jgi:hypothetical protein
MLGKRDRLEEMFANGLDRAVEVVGMDKSKTIMEGYINEMTFQIGGIELRRRLGRMANQVWARFTDGVTSGLRSSVFDDTDQQARHGVKQRIFSAGKTISLGQADQIARVLFNRVRTASNPSITRLGRVTEPGEISLLVQCNGWWHKLYWQVYNNAGGSGTIAAYAFIEAMLAAWSGPLPIDNRAIERNDSPLQAEIDNDMAIADHMFNATAIGDQLYRRWIVGVREKRTLYFKPAAQTVLA